MTILYLGTDPSRFPRQEKLVHFPVIRVMPLPLAEEVRRELTCITHVLVTSPNTAHFLWKEFRGKTLLAIGKGTAAVLQSYDFRVSCVANPESQEGMIGLLSSMSLQDAYIFYPRSTRARSLLAQYLQKKEIRHLICDAYQTVAARPEITVDFATVKEIVFTSPSTVHAFAELYGKVPEHIQCTCIGPVTSTCFLKQTSVQSPENRSLP